MKFKKFILWSNAIVWIIFGLGYVVIPEIFAGWVGVSMSKADALKIMADVGIMMSGIGIWYIYCALDDARIRYGLISALLVCSGMWAGRVISMCTNGHTSNVNMLYFVFEAVNMVLIFVALRMQDSPSAPIEAETAIP